MATRRGKKAILEPKPQVRGTWTVEEDEALRKGVEQYGAKNWKKIAELVPRRSDVQCLHRWQKVLNPALVKGPWTEEEDEKVKELVGMYGAKKWSLIASFLPGRIGKQCRERWANHLDPTVKKGAWQPWEDELIIKLQRIHGNKWAKMCKDLPGRTDNAIKNRFNSTISRRIKQDKTLSRTTKKSSTTKTKKAVPDAETDSGITKTYPSRSTTNKLRQHAALLRRVSLVVEANESWKTHSFPVPSSPSSLCPLPSYTSEDEHIDGPFLGGSDEQSDNTISSDDDFEVEEEEEASISETSLLSPISSGSGQKLWYRPETPSGARVYEEEEVASAAFLSFVSEVVSSPRRSFLNDENRENQSYACTRSPPYLSCRSAYSTCSPPSTPLSCAFASPQQQALRPLTQFLQPVPARKAKRRLVLSEDEQCPLPPPAPLVVSASRGDPCFPQHNNNNNNTSISTASCNFVNNPKNFSTDTFLSPAVVVTPNLVLSSMMSSAAVAQTEEDLLSSFSSSLRSWGGNNTNTLQFSDGAMKASLALCNLNKGELLQQQEAFLPSSSSVGV